MEAQKFELPGKANDLLATMAEYYKTKNNDRLHRVLVNSHVHVNESVAYDNWDGGTYCHQMVLRLPDRLFVAIIDDLPEVVQELTQLVNRLCNQPNEAWNSVSFEREPSSLDPEWREKSGVYVGPLASGPRDEDVGNIWGSGSPKIFLSHRSEIKEFTNELAEQLRLYQLAPFVAHENIKPDEEWLQVIRRALWSMDVLVALLTPEFPQSPWTDQEVGAAVGRGVPVVGVRLGRDPYGFIGERQGLNGFNGGELKSAEVLATDIVYVLEGRPQFQAQIRERKKDAIDGTIVKLAQSSGWRTAEVIARDLVGLVERLKWRLTTDQVQALERVSAENRYVSTAFRMASILNPLLEEQRVALRFG